MPLSKKGREILAAMRTTYARKGGEKKAKSVFYASINSGRIKGAESDESRNAGGRK